MKNESLIEEPTEEEIVENILASREEDITKWPSGRQTEWAKLKYGSKMLEVVISDGGISTKVTNVGAERRDGETTLLYRAAKQLMEAAVTKLGVSLEYSFHTVNKNMAEWADTKGAWIFNWDRSYDRKLSGEEGVNHVRKKVFYPQETKTNI